MALLINGFGEFSVEPPAKPRMRTCRMCRRLRVETDIRNGLCKECRIRLIYRLPKPKPVPETAFSKPMTRKGAKRKRNDHIGTLRDFLESGEKLRAFSFATPREVDTAYTGFTRARASRRDEFGRIRIKRAGRAIYLSLEE